MFRAVTAWILEEFEDVRWSSYSQNQKSENWLADFLEGRAGEIIEPLGEVIDFHNFMNQSYMILTDSGGVKKEALL